MKKYKAFTLSLFLAILGTFWGMVTPISAAEPVDSPQVCEVTDCNPTNSFRAVGVSRAGIVYGSYVELASNTSGAAKDGDTLSASSGLTYSNSISGTISAAYGTVSSAVGFNVTASSTKTATYSITLHKGQKGIIYVRPKYQVYHVKLQRYWSGTLGCNFWKDDGTATVLQFIGFDFKPVVW